ncbi:PTS sugar transporter subunit IIA [Georgenia subflava]|uniref:PTS glucose transporter subunit IIA n=1 Tax=Georgenia subflava TaxID=1622177 RepID=A0A6N7ESD0_9MICO|nr:PTS glucose transporter subunit IIA [Georgenia subflava]MPV39016.1 PTS glucose transporter subunit IIA [Georgenia subflava]
MTLRVLAPVAGTVLALEDVPDPVFSGAIVGPGIAVDPGDVASVEARSPVDGTIMKLHPHAFVVLTGEGQGVLVHLGLDTVQLGGEGFTLHAAEKDAVTAGQLLVTWSPKDVAAGGRSPVTPVIALEGSAEALTTVVAPGDAVAAGDELFSWE